MSKLVSVDDLHYNHSYRFHLKFPAPIQYERSYHGKEEIRGKQYIKVRKLDGNFAPSLALEDITDIEPLIIKAAKKKTKRK